LDGEALYTRDEAGRTFVTRDLESWQLENRAPGPPPPSLVFPTTLPEPGAIAKSADPFHLRLYAFGRHVYRSEDGGWSWRNTTAWAGHSLIGGPVSDLAVHPSDPDVIVAVNDYGIWRSADGGRSWCGLNGGLPNLPVRKLLATPSGVRGARIQLAGGLNLEWPPGERQSWLPVEDPSAAALEKARAEVSRQTGAQITAVAMGNEYSYAGSADGTLWVSRDQGQTWYWSRRGEGAPVTAIQIVPKEPAQAIAVLAEPPDGAPGPRVLRTLDGGTNWANLTGSLPPGSVWGVAADPQGSAVYLATERGVFLSVASGAAGLGSEWISLSANLPAAPVRDVRLDEAGNQLFVALDGYGIYAAPAPHRFWQVEVASAADLSSRPAAPGSLLTVLGGRLIRAQAGLLPVPVLFASETQSQLQIPFEVTGPATELALELEHGRYQFNLPLLDVSPAIFVDGDGSAMLMDADTGVILDALHPARPGMRVQILVTGLGRVIPAWRTGVAAPAQDPPQVVAPVRAFLGESPLQVTRATLAPGYVGFYLVEVVMPSLLDAGPAELVVEASGRWSNRVRIYLEP
jgi:uncharacterized protein (TIGR03437 family)